VREVQLYVRTTSGIGYLGSVFVNGHPKVVVWQNRFFLLTEVEDIYTECSGFISNGAIKT
jgi:hypothetical protein